MVKERGYQESLEPRVLHFIKEHHLLSDQRCLLVGVSGGQDSVCLLNILFQLREELNIELHVAHLNHQLRGAESEADAQYVSDLARQLGIPATVEQRDVRAYHARCHASLEEAAREVRYTFLAQVAKSLRTDRVAVGHTTDDHLETILMHLVRGTGTRGEIIGGTINEGGKLYEAYQVFNCGIFVVSVWNRADPRFFGYRDHWFIVEDGYS